MSYGGVIEGWLVTEPIEAASPKLPDYTLLPGDLLLKREDGTYGKFGPGLGIEGFVLTPEQEASLEPSGEKAFRMGGISEFVGGLADGD